MRTIKQLLYDRLDPAEIARAHAATGGALDDLDFVDFVALEWVNSDGYTTAQRLAATGEVPAAVARWSDEVRHALWVVDGWEGDQVLLRDVATEEELAVDAPGLQGELTRRTVLRARAIPLDQRWVFSGSPDVYGEMGVIARMDLLASWDRQHLDALAARRATYRQLREERDAWVAWFGADEQVFPDAEALAAALVGFVSHLMNEARFPSLGGRTRAEASRSLRGEEPHIVSYTLGPTLTGPGRHGVVYDRVEGIHFLPGYGEFQEELRGGGGPTVDRYREDPGVTLLPFRRTLPDRDWAAELPEKAGPAAPSVLPGWGVSAEPGP